MSKDEWKGRIQIDQEDKLQIWTSMDKKEFLDVKKGRGEFFSKYIYFSLEVDNRSFPRHDDFFLFFIANKIRTTVNN